MSTVGRDRDPYRHLEAGLRRLVAMRPDDPARGALRNGLAVGFTPVCRAVARRFVRQNEPIEDLEQVAMIGMLKALDHFRLMPQPDPIPAFLGYAIPTATGEIQRHLRDHTWVVHVPRPVKDLQGRVWRTVSELTRESDHRPGLSQIAAHLGIERELVVEAVQAASARRPTSTDAATGVHEEPLVDRLPCVDDEFVDMDCRNDLREALRLLPPRSVRIISMRFFADLTQREIGAELGISQMQVSRVLSRSLATLRAGMAG